MNRVRAVCLFSLTEFGLVAGGYLATECAVTFLYGRANAPFPNIIRYATEDWWLFAITSLAWAAHSIYAGIHFRRPIFSTYLPYALGVALLGFTLLFYMTAVATAAYGPPRHLWV